MRAYLTILLLFGVSCAGSKASTVPATEPLTDETPAVEPAGLVDTVEAWIEEPKGKLSPDVEPLLSRKLVLERMYFDGKVHRVLFVQADAEPDAPAVLLTVERQGERWIVAHSESAPASTLSDR